MDEMQQIIERINQLTATSRERELTEAELHERRQLRAAYMKNFRASFRGELDSTFVQTDDGEKVPLRDWNERVRKDAEDAFKS